jgi:hypothetical protein
VEGVQSILGQLNPNPNLNPPSTGRGLSAVSKS